MRSKTASQRPRPVRPRGVLSVAGFFCLLWSAPGCAGDSDDAAVRGTGAPLAATAEPQIRGTPTSELRHLGYSGWDEPSDARAEGVTRYSQAKASAWPRVWADDRSTVHIVHPDGRSLRSIAVPGRTQVEFARVLEGGRILCLSVDEGLTLLEPDGTLAWSIDMPAHHDVTVVPDGRAPGSRLFACLTHRPHEYSGRQVRFDEVVCVDESTGRVCVDESAPVWDSFAAREQVMDALDRGSHPLDTAVESRQDRTVYDYFHANAIAFDGPETMLLCLRNVDAIVALKVSSGAIAWSFGPGVLDWPHAPSLVDIDGERRVLLFDNGKHRGWSRVLEFDPVRGVITWAWPSEPPAGEGSLLWSDVRGFAQRLPGGNTLVTESERGRALEVTREGDQVWEFHNPEFRSGESGRERRRMYRVMAIDPERLAESPSNARTGPSKR